MMSFSRFCKETLRGILNGSKQLAYKPINHLDATIPLRWSLVSKPTQALQWHNISWSNPTYNIRRKACNDFLQRYVKRFTLVSFVSAYLAEQKETPEEKPSLQDCIQSFQSSIDYSLQNKSVETYSCHAREYHIGKRLGSACNAVVYEASTYGKECAVKVIFNYHAQSNGNAILNTFKQEYKALSDKDDDVGLKKHPNIIRLLAHFVDYTPVNEDLVTNNPAALPIRYGGVARNKTLFLVMPKYSCSVREYLWNNRMNISFDARVHMFCQLLEAVAHLECSGVAHRDIKTDNILLNIVDGEKYPQLVLADFGDSFFGNNMLLPFESEYVDKGGNPSLMAPEIINAVPGKNCVLNYSKADAWSVGTLAYEIFGWENPFYNQLQNTSYNHKQLPPLRSGCDFVDKVVYEMLQCDPERRLSARNAATILFLMLFLPNEWLNGIRDDADLCRWILATAIITMRKYKQHKVNADVQLHMVFLNRISIMEIRDALVTISRISAGQDE